MLNGDMIEFLDYIEQLFISSDLVKAIVIIPLCLLGVGARSWVHKQKYK
tara:strand:- start:39 stop:185 length:147 start_codon:yes stop_codon:yes gene_type:complete